MLTNVHESDDIDRLTFHIFMSPCQNSLFDNSVNSFRLKVSFFCQMFRSKSKKVENGLKLNVMFTLFVQFLVKIVFFQITSLSIE